MTDEAFVDAAQPATLKNGGGKLTDYPTLQEAVMAWPATRTDEARDDQDNRWASLYCD